MFQGVYSPFIFISTNYSCGQLVCRTKINTHMQTTRYNLQMWIEINILNILKAAILCYTFTTCPKGYEMSHTCFVKRNLVIANQEEISMSWIPFYIFIQCKGNLSFNCLITIVTLNKRVWGSDPQCSNNIPVIIGWYLKDRNRKKKS